MSFLFRVLGGRHKKGHKSYDKELIQPQQSPETLLPFPVGEVKRFVALRKIGAVL